MMAVFTCIHLPNSKYIYRKLSEIIQSEYASCKYVSQVGINISVNKIMTVIANLHLVFPHHWINSIPV